MIESRCGIVCSECGYRESQGCKGCVNVDKPFWGECPVKASCESKNHAHCGECGEFPCKLLESFSYAENEHGDDGKRIKQCEKWAANNET